MCVVHGVYCILLSRCLQDPKNTSLFAEQIVWSAEWSMCSLVEIKEQEWIKPYPIDFRVPCALGLLCVLNILELHLHKKQIRCEYLWKKGIHYVIENPSSTILWQYQPMEAWVPKVLRCCCGNSTLSKRHIKFQLVALYHQLWMLKFQGVKFDFAKAHFDLNQQLARICFAATSAKPSLFRLVPLEPKVWVLVAFIKKWNVMKWSWLTWTYAGSTLKSDLQSPGRIHLSVWGFCQLSWSEPSMAS